MPRIPEQKRPSIDWDSLSEKIGDFIVDKFSMPDKYFVDKYGEEWESKRDKQRKIDRSFHGLLPAKNASQTRLALEALSHLPAADRYSERLFLFLGDNQLLRVILQNYLDRALKSGVEETFQLKRV